MELSVLDNVLVGTYIAGMNERSVGYARLNALVADFTEDGVMEMVATRVADGEALKDIVRTQGMPYSVLWRWLKADAKRMQAYENALEAKADAEAHRMLEIADGADNDSVQIARLRMDARKWLAAKWDKKRYGEEKEAARGFGGGITIVIGDVKPAEVIAGEVVDQEVVVEQKVI